ncbi:MAG: tetratricopeptide repeat protein [Pirellulaceae bacterium]
MSAKKKSRPVLIRMFRQYLSDEQSARFISDVSRQYTIPTLERLAEYGDRTTRRAATMALGFLGGYSSNQVLGRRMADTDRSVRLLAENGIRELWSRDGNDEQRQQLQRIMRLNRSADYLTALTEATDLIDESPWFAEAWNQRGVANYYLGRYQDAIRDCQQTLELNPYHYAAAIGMAHCYLELDDARGALDSFRRALKLNPDLEDVRTRISFLKQAFEES